MNNEQAKQILIAYRPDRVEKPDPETTEALRLLDRDPELRRWFETQNLLHAKIRTELRQIPVPDSLKAQILRHAPRPKPIPLPLRHPWWLAAAASFLLALGLWFLWTPKHSENLTFSGFQRRMVGFALREYRMDIVTNDLDSIRQFLAGRGAPADYNIPPGLARTPAKGGARLSWQGHPVSMICFDGQRRQTLYLFVIDSASFTTGTLPAPTPELEQISHLTTASWREGSKVYLLAVPGSPERLKELLSARLQRPQPPEEPSDLPGNSLVKRSSTNPWKLPQGWCRIQSSVWL